MESSLIQNDSVPFAKSVLVPNHNLQEFAQSMTITPTNSSSVISFEKCSGITIGSNFFISASTLPVNAVTKANSLTLDMDEADIYRKTPTIKEMLESNVPMSAAFQELVAQSLGTRWMELRIRLGISEITVENLYEDNFKKGGIKEVSYQMLSRYLNENKDKATEGWIISFLWNNGFRKSVWSIKDLYKVFKVLRQEE